MTGSWNEPSTSQAGRGMPAVMIRQLDALSKIMEHATSAEQREVLLAQADMIQRSSEESVPEESERLDVRRRYEAAKASASTRQPMPTPPADRAASALTEPGRA